MRRGCLVFVLALAAACNGDDDGGDGACTIAVNFDNASCGDQINFTGELVDWDNEARFCGINEALFQVQGDGAMDTTSPNGRFEGLCVPDQPVTLLDVTPEPGNSVCTTPPSPYPLPGIAVA